MTIEDIDQRLEKLENNVEAIINLFDSDGSCHISQPNMTLAQALFKKLKEDFKAEYKRMDSVREQANLSEDELAFYHPAISNAWANSTISRVRWNSRPDGSWFSALYEVQGYMSYWRDQLKSYKAA